MRQKLSDPGAFETRRVAAEAAILEDIPGVEFNTWVSSELRVRGTRAANIASERVFRQVNKAGGVWGTGMTEKVVWHIVR
jgi:hypothetical protein